MDKKTVWLVCGKVFLGVVAPFLIAAAFLYIRDDQMITKVMPTWSDEFFYYNQTKAVLSHMQPLGYFGYDGSHAVIGNFGTHGFILLLPYIIGGWILGMEYYTFTVINIGLVSIAMLIYIVLFRPAYRQIISLLICIFSPMVIFYLNTGMTEGENYFFAVTIALLMLYVIKEGSKKATSVLGILILWALCSRVTWALLLFPYTLIVLRKNTGLSQKQKIAKSIIVTGICGAIGYVMFLLCGANYFEGSSIISSYLRTIREEGLGKGIYFFVENVLENIISTWFVLDSSWLGVCRLFLLVTLIFSLLFFLFQYKRISYAYIPLLVMVGYMLGIAVFYTGGGSAVRAVYSAAVFAQTFILVSYFEVSENRRKQGSFVVCILYFFFFLFGFLSKQEGGDREYYVKEDEAFYKHLEEYMGNIQLDISGTKPWDNTLVIAMNSYPDPIYELFVPAGTGINYYRDIPEDLSEFKAKYVLLSNENLEDIQWLKEAGYAILDSDQQTTLLKKSTEKVFITK